MKYAALLLAAAALAVPMVAVPVMAQEAPPAAPVEVVTDDYYGTRVADPYRWMEDGKDPRWLPWLRAQAAHTAATMARLPGRAAMLADMAALSGDQVAVGQVRRAGDSLFFARRDRGAEDPRLYVKTGAGAERLLVDPATVLPTAQALDWWIPSPDGRLVAVGLSKRGSEASVLHVMDVATGKLSATRIPATDSGQVTWLPDSSGFAYLQFQGQQGTPTYYADGLMKLHRIGAAGPDAVLMARAAAPVKLAPTDWAVIDFDRDRDLAVLVVNDGRRESKLYLTQRSALVAGRPQWRRVGEYEAQIESAAPLGDQLWVKTTRDAPNGKLLVTSLARPDLATARAVAVPGDPVIQGIAGLKSAVLVSTIEGGQNGLWRIGADGTPRRVTLPFAGRMSVLSTIDGTDEAFLSLTGWQQPSDVYHLTADGAVHPLKMASTPAGFDPARYETRALTARAKDGTLIPYTIVQRKGAASPGPLLLEAYGAYGSAILPAFNPRLIPLLDRGGRYVIANVRGGGEFGRDWHYAGKGPTKANTWLDAIAVAEQLVADRVTTAAQMTLIGTSAGGVMVGGAVNARPDLFAGAIANVGFMNPVRYVSEQNNADMPEWGGPITDAASFKTMFDLDPYQHIKPGTRYPATLVVSGINDPRAATFHGAKYAARLAAATTSGEPVLLRIDFDAGHGSGFGSSRSQSDALWTDIYSFVLWQAGVPDFQPAAAK